MPTRHGPARWLLRAVPFLAVGQILHVGLALLLAWLVPPAIFRNGVFTSRLHAWSDPQTGLTRVVVSQSSFGQRWSWQMLASHGFGVSGGDTTEAFDILNIEPAQQPMLQTVVVPRRRSLRSHDPVRADVLENNKGEPGVMARWPVEHRSGWPTPALQCWHPCVAWVWGATLYQRYPGLPEIDGGIMVPKAQPTTLPHTIPLTPHWPGLIAGAVFWGGLLWCCWSGMGVLRRTIRGRRGLCLSCGYPRSGWTICPECGSPAPEPRPRTA
jgi:hypothetical protein